MVLLTKPSIQYQYLRLSKMFYSIHYVMIQIQYLVVMFRNKIIYLFMTFQRKCSNKYHDRVISDLRYNQQLELENLSNLSATCQNYVKLHDLFVHKQKYYIGPNLKFSFRGNRKVGRKVNSLPKVIGWQHSICITMNIQPVSATMWIWVSDLNFSLPRQRSRVQNQSHLCVCMSFCMCVLTWLTLWCV